MKKSTTTIPASAKDKHGFVKASKFKPNPYDLVQIRMTDNSCYSAWWTGERWDGGRIPKDKEVKDWRKMTEYLGAAY